MVDTTLDKLILLTVGASTEIITPAVLDDNDNILTEAELLSDIPIFSLGNKLMQTASERIVLARTNNKKNGEGFDFTERKVTFGFNIQIKETTDYLKAQDRINDIENALVRTLMKSDELNEYNGTMSIDDIDQYPEEDMILDMEEVFVSFIVEEDWSVEDNEFNEITYKGEMMPNGS